jgi:tetratricopeptide (TPR) repeat protein
VPENRKPEGKSFPALQHIGESKMKNEQVIDNSNFDLEYEICDALFEIDKVYFNNKAESHLNDLLRITEDISRDSDIFELSLHKLLGDNFFEKSIYDMAEEAYRSILENNELSSKLVPFQNAELHRNLGIIAYKRGQYEMALFLLDKSLALFRSLEG